MFLLFLNRDFTIKYGMNSHGMAIRSIKITMKGNKRKDKWYARRKPVSGTMRTKGAMKQNNIDSQEYNFKKLSISCGMIKTTDRPRRLSDRYLMMPQPLLLILFITKVCYKSKNRQHE